MIHILLPPTWAGHEWVAVKPTPCPITIGDEPWPHANPCPLALCVHGTLPIPVGERVALVSELRCPEGVLLDVEHAITHSAVVAEVLPIEGMDGNTYPSVVVGSDHATYFPFEGATGSEVVTITIVGDLTPGNIAVRLAGTRPSLEVLLDGTKFADWAPNVPVTVPRRGLDYWQVAP